MPHNQKEVEFIIDELESIAFVNGLDSSLVCRLINCYIDLATTMQEAKKPVDWQGWRVIPSRYCKAIKPVIVINTRV